MGRATGGKPTFVPSPDEVLAIQASPRQGQAMGAHRSVALKYARDAKAGCRDGERATDGEPPPRTLARSQDPVQSLIATMAITATSSDRLYGFESPRGAARALAGARFV
jgi:hypothetical protein